MEHEVEVILNRTKLNWAVVCVPKKHFRVNPFYTKHVLKSVDKIFNFKNVVKKSP